MRRIESQITTSKYTINIVNRFVCLGSAVTRKMLSACKLNINLLLLVSVWVLLAVEQQRYSMLHLTKLMLYMPLMFLVLLYGAKELTLLRSYAGNWKYSGETLYIRYSVHMRTNKELCDLLNDSALTWKGMFKRDEFLMWKLLTKISYIS